jgi:hypothetical protein
MEYYEMKILFFGKRKFPVRVMDFSAFSYSGRFCGREN